MASCEYTSSEVSLNMGYLRVMIIVTTLVLESIASPYNSSREDEEDECDRRRSETDMRIAGGQSAFFDPEAGFMASIMGFRATFEQVFCAGFILNDDTIGTAAYCVFNVEPANMEVRVGSVMICFGTRIPIESVIVNPLYDSKKPENGGNLALLKSKQGIFPAGTDGIIHAINYTPNKYKLPEEGSKVTVYGYGKIRQDDSESNVNTLMKVEIPIISPDQCAVSYFFSVAENEFCAGTLLGGRGPCKGDIGGPAMYQDRLVGVVAGGRGCGAPASPSVFTDMGHEDNSNFMASFMETIEDGGEK